MKEIVADPLHSYLMTGIAEVESSYLQFFSQDLLGTTALWPHESHDGGSYIGLMQAPTAQALAWDWQQNASYGVTTVFLGQKIPAATNMMNYILNGSVTCAY
jgi:hypothetical protein